MTLPGQKTIDDIEEAINQYKAIFRRQDLPPLAFSGLYALFPDVELLPAVALKWPDPWPTAQRNGVYFIFGVGGRLLYVGKASMSNTIGARLSSYFQYNRPGMGCKVVHSGWSETPRYVATLAVPAKMPFEAPALEEFLIERLAPPENVKGRSSDRRGPDAQPNESIQPTGCAGD